MDDRIINLGFLWFFGAAVLGPLVGWLLRRRIGFERAVGVGCLIIGLTGSAAGVVGALDRAAQVREMLQAEGHFQEYVEEFSRDSEGKVTRNVSPLVAFKTADGVEHVIKGLGGSQPERSPGDVVPLIYHPDAPESAVINDFQNLWGVILAFAIFGGMPTLFGIFFLFFAAEHDAPRQAAPPGRFDAVRKQYSGYFVIAGNVAFACAGILLFLVGDDTLFGIARAFSVVAVACGIHLVAELVSPQREWMRVGVLVVVGVGFALFGGGGLLLAG